MSKKLLIVIGVVFPLVAAGILLVVFIRARSTPASSACINNLRQIDEAKQQWALEKGATTNQSPSWEDIRAYVGRGAQAELAKCPEGGTYILGRIGEPPKCSIGGPSHSISD
jgi:hypothetical protein